MLYKVYKTKLNPNNIQASKMTQTASCTRYAYNWALETEQKNYKNGGKFLTDCELRKMFTFHKINNPWLYDVSCNATKQSIKDAYNAYLRFFKHKSKIPRFKSKKRTKPSFYVGTDHIEITNTHVKLEKIASSKRKNRAQANWVRLKEHGRIPIGCKYTNPRVTFDGLDWWLSVGVEVEQQMHSPSGLPVGIDLGVKYLAVCSDGVKYININKTNALKKIEKRKRRLQHQVSRKYQMNKKENVYHKTNNIIKLEKQLLKVNHKLTNIRHNNLHQVTSSIIKREPSVIIMEDLSVVDMMKNRHLAKFVQQQCFSKFCHQIQYKCEWKNITFIMANRYYPSSKLCSDCDFKNKDLSLNDRTYTCSKCGMIIDRDLNAAINLSKLANIK